MFHLLLLVHRYLGIALGIVVALWCLSGFVMMYVQYPALSEREYLAGLPVLDFADCCVANPEVLNQLDGVDEIDIELLAGLPVLRARFGQDNSLLVNLASGWWFSSINRETAMQQADAFLEASDSSGEARFVARRGRDQWTVGSDLDAYRPLFQFAADNEDGTHVYVSSVNGKVVQTTSSHERLWNRFGAVIHWIYPTALRQNATLWAQVVIWLTLASLFLIVIGLYLGIKQFGARDDGARSPYQGVYLWHHYAGLLFGLLTVTWLFSGLLSMNPWGALEGDSGEAERQGLRGGTLSAAAITTVVESLGNTALPVGTVQLRSILLNGELALIASDAAASPTRLDGERLHPESLAAGAWRRVAERVGPGKPVREAGLLAAGDHYYFSHHEEVALPVYRIIFDDEQQTRYYFDPTSAELLRKVDRDRRWNRWLFLGLHRGDFTARLRSRPLWDLIMLPLMLGVACGAFTGAWLGYRRLTK